MSTIHKIAEGTFSLSLSELITLFINFSATVILIRALGVYDFGLLTLTLAGFLIASIFLDLGITSVIITDVSREIGAKREDRAKGLLVRYCQAELIIGFVLFLIVFSSSLFIGKFYNEVIVELVRIGSFFLILTGIKNIFLVVFNSHLKFKIFSFMQITESFSKLIFVAILVLVMNLGAIGAMLVYPLSILVSVIISAPFFVKTIKYFKFTKTAKEGLFFKNLKGHGKWVMGSVSLKNLTNNITPWIIEYFLGVSSVAIFSVASKFSIFFESLLRSLETTLMPITSKEIFKWEKIKFMLNKSVKYALWVSLPSFFILSITLPILIEILFTKSYMTSVPILTILLFLLIICPFSFVFKPLLYAFKLQKYLFYSYAISLILFILLEILLIQFIGLIGIAVSFVLNSLILTILRYYFARKVKSDFKIDFKKFFEIDEFDKKLFKKLKYKSKIFR